MDAAIISMPAKMLGVAQHFFTSYLRARGISSCSAMPVITPATSPIMIPIAKGLILPVFSTAKPISAPIGSATDSRPGHSLPSAARGIVNWHTNGDALWDVVNSNCDGYGDPDLGISNVARESSEPLGKIVKGKPDTNKNGSA